MEEAKDEKSLAVRASLEQACIELRSVLKEMDGQEDHPAMAHVVGIVRQQLAAAEGALEQARSAESP